MKAIVNLAVFLGSLWFLLGDVNGDDAEVKRYLQCKSIEDALRGLQMDVEEDRAAMFEAAKAAEEAE